MSDHSTAGTSDVTPFPMVRLFYALAFAIVAWFVMHLVIVLALTQFVLLALNRRLNEELKDFCSSLVRYLSEIVTFITFTSDERPFPFGPFPPPR